MLYVLFLIDRPFVLDESFQVFPLRYVVSFDETPPSQGWVPYDAEARPVRALSDPFTSVWYEFPVSSIQDAASVYVPFPSANLDIWFAGQQLVQLGPMERPLYHGRYPVLRPLLQSERGEHKLFMRVARYSERTDPPRTYIAPYGLAERDFNDQAFTRRWASVFVLIVMSVFVIANLGVYALNREEGAYGLYALTMILWGLHTAHGLVNQIPFHHAVWFGLNYVLLLWVVVELIFIDRFFSIPAIRLERFVLSVSLGAAALVLIVAAGSTWSAMSAVVSWIFVPWILVCTLLVISRYFVALRSSWTFESVSLWLVSGAFLGVGIRDLFYELSLPGWTPPGSAYYLQFVAALPMAVFGFHLMRRYMVALRLARMKNQELDDTIAERTLALEESYKKVAEEQSQRKLAEERARLMRDMHDGLGGQLVHALALSEQGTDEDLQKALRLALDDLRLVVESLSPEENGLPELIASYRHRVAKVIARTGTQVSWEIGELQQSRALSPKYALNVLRVLQEAVTNAVRHSGAGLIRVVLQEAPQGIVLQVVDDGIGMDNVGSGRGLDNMRVRAQEIDTDVEISSSSAGTTVSLVLRR